MLDAADTQNAFKCAEKHYQLHQSLHLSKRSGRKKAQQQPSTDLSEVIDVHGRVAGCQGSKQALNKLYIPDHALSTVPCEVADMVQGADVYSLRSCPGCLLFPGWLRAQAQVKLATDAFIKFPEPPAVTNHTAKHGQVQGLWHAAQAGKLLEKAERSSHWHWIACEPHHRNKCGDFMPGVLPATRLFRHLRWASLGPQYDWANRSYNRTGDCAPMPNYLTALARYFASVAAASETQGGSPPGASPPTTSSSVVCVSSVHDNAHGSTQPSTGTCRCVDHHEDTQADRNDVECRSTARAEALSSANTHAFEPDAALVNYYWHGDTLNGHQDNVEPDLSQPIVSFSLGCDAVFLIGGQSKSQKPTALLLSSGDVIVMTAAARLCFHGVPRVFPEHKLPESLQSYTSAGEPAGSDCDGGHQDGALPPIEHVLATLQQCRVNISVRHTRPQIDDTSVRLANPVVSQPSCNAMSQHHLSGTSLP